MQKEDLHFDRKLVFVRKAKGKKDRFTIVSTRNIGNIKSPGDSLDI